MAFLVYVKYIVDGFGHYTVLLIHYLVMHSIELNDRIDFIKTAVTPGFKLCFQLYVYPSLKVYPILNGFPVQEKAAR